MTHKSICHGITGLGFPTSETSAINPKHNICYQYLWTLTYQLEGVSASDRPLMISWHLLQNIDTCEKTWLIWLGIVQS